MKTSRTPPPPPIAFAVFAGARSRCADSEAGEAIVPTDGTMPYSHHPFSFTSVATYLSILCFAFIAIAFVGPTNNNYSQVHTKIALSNELLKQKSLDISREKDLETKASADMNEGDSLSAQAQELANSGAEKMKKADRDAEKAKGLHDEAEQERKEAKGLRDQASEDDMLYETIKANATKLSDMAKKDRVEADEVTFPGSSWCQRRMFQRLCDALGSATRIRTADAAQVGAVEAREAFDEYYRAKAVRDREDEELMKAAQLEDRAKHDDEEYHHLEVQAKRERESGDEEQKLAEKDQADAKNILQKSAEEVDEANSFKTKALADSNRADALREQALEHGQKAYMYGIFATVFATVSLAFFSIRFVTKFGSVLYWHMADYWTWLAHDQQCSPNRGVDMPQVARKTWDCIPKARILRWLVECTALLASVAVFAHQWTHFKDYSTRNRGALVLVCAFVSGLAQSLALFTFPAFHSAIGSLDMETDRLLQGRTMRAIALETLSYFSLSLAISTLLSIMLILILWINMGDAFVALADWFNGPFLWLVFVLGSYVYLRCFPGITAEKPPQATGSRDDNSQSVSTISKDPVFRTEDSNASNGCPTEKDFLLDKEWGIRIRDDEVVVAGSVDTSSDERMDVLLDNSIIRSSQDGNSIESSDMGNNSLTVVTIIIEVLRFPFEVLVLSCMIAIIRVSVSHCLELSFAFDHVGFSAKIWWLWATISVAIMLTVFNITKTYSQHQDRAKQKDGAPTLSHFVHA
mmetsp:Transcript_8271/g.17875  ORF Transcript_8271/g.17875 Transcript_8271/m.17875 type:complete len:752 (-) Transcript_8271:51-2306(-)